MNIAITTLTLAGTLSLGVWIGTANSNQEVQDRTGTQERDTQEAGAPAAMAEMMEAMTRAGTPGEAHRKLDPLVGEWDAAITMWMDPNMPAMETTGSASYAWILGGHYLEGQFEGDFMGQPFEGRSVFGYDNTAEEFFSSWIDNSSTALMTQRGAWLADGDGFDLSGEAMCPMTNGPCLNEEQVTFDGPDQFTSVMHTTRDGNRYKSMEIVYTRAN